MNTSRPSPTTGGRYPIEPLAPGYSYLAEHDGYAHLIQTITPGGGATTVCGRTGTKLSNRGLTEMVRCPECDLFRQLL